MHKFPGGTPMLLERDALPRGTHALAGRAPSRDARPRGTRSLAGRAPSWDTHPRGTRARGSGSRLNMVA